MIALRRGSDRTLTRRCGVRKSKAVRAPFNKQKEQEHGGKDATPVPSYAKFWDLPVQHSVEFINTKMIRARIAEKVFDNLYRQSDNCFKEMKTLYILRHAKSSWDDPDLADFDRPLNQRGTQAAPFMGEIMAKDDLIPELIISSPAVRARETARLAKEGGRLSVDIRHDERIYEASPQTLHQVASSADDSYSSLMLVGHNPGMEGFVRYLTGKLEAMPTASLAVIDLDIDSWKDLAVGVGRLRRIIRPKDEMRSIGKGR